MSLPPSPLGNVPFARYAPLTGGETPPLRILSIHWRNIEHPRRGRVSRPFSPDLYNVTNRAGQGKNDYLRTVHALSARTAGRRGRPVCRPGRHGRQQERAWCHAYRYFPDPLDSLHFPISGRRNASPTDSIDTMASLTGVPWSRWRIGVYRLRGRRIRCRLFVRR